MLSFHSLQKTYRQSGNGQSALKQVQYSVRRVIEKALIQRHDNSCYLGVHNTHHSSPWKPWLGGRRSCMVRRDSGSSVLHFVSFGRLRQEDCHRAAPSSRKGCACTAVLWLSQCLSRACISALSIHNCLQHFYPSRNNVISLRCFPCHCLALFILPGAKPWHFCWILKEKSFFLFFTWMRRLWQKDCMKGMSLQWKEWGVGKGLTNLNTEVGFLLLLPAVKGWSPLTSQPLFFPMPAHSETSPKPPHLHFCLDPQHPRAYGKAESAADASINSQCITVWSSRTDLNFAWYKEMKISNSGSRTQCPQWGNWHSEQRD